MPATIDLKKVSPVNVDERKRLGVRAGDTIKVSQKVLEKEGKYRIQVFEGLVIAVKHGTEAGGTFTVRATMSGVGVEKIFPLYSPMIEKIEIIRRSKVRRAKLYYIRDKVARDIRRQLRNMKLMALSTSETDTKQAAPKADAEAPEAQVEVTPEKS
jgi:large subunit ribosomal protein L19